MAKKLEPKPTPINVPLTWGPWPGQKPNTSEIGAKEFSDAINQMALQLGDLLWRRLPTQAHRPAHAAAKLALNALVEASWLFQTAEEGHPEREARSARLLEALHVLQGETDRLTQQGKFIASVARACDESDPENRQVTVALTIACVIAPSAGSYLDCSDQVADLAERVISAWTSKDPAKKWERMNECMREIDLHRESGKALRRYWYHYREKQK